MLITIGYGDAKTMPSISGFQWDFTVIVWVMLFGLILH
jgi:hypothetical protein